MEPSLAPPHCGHDASASVGAVSHTGKPGRHYLPRPGTLTMLLVQFMHSKPVGRGFTTRELIDGTGVPDSHIRCSLKAGVGRGLVRISRRGRRTFFALTRHIPEVEQEIGARLLTGYGTNPPGADLVAAWYGRSA